MLCPPLLLGHKRRGLVIPVRPSMLHRSVLGSMLIVKARSGQYPQLGDPTGFLDSATCSRSEGEIQ